MTWLAGKLKSHAARTITYRRGTASVSITATLASQLLRVSDHQGNTKVERPDADFIFTAADLILSGSVVEPADDDLVDVVYGSVTKRFRLMPMNRGQEPSWRFSDPHQKLIRVHTKHVGNV